ncbi:MAG: HEPN domain-containing protein [Desulfomonile tiedjei]|nr:HEPN domain-containing protein [Desulfomonile tiedjei]
MAQRARDWLKEAQAELNACLDLLRGKHWSWCCFTCQQAAEKALKAVCEHFRSPQFGHNLNLLLQAIEEHMVVAESVRMACGRLNRHYIPTRYPNAFDRGAPAEQFFEADARQALEDAEEVYRFAEGLVGSP